MRHIWLEYVLTLISFYGNRSGVSLAYDLSMVLSYFNQVYILAEIVVSVIHRYAL